MPGDLPKAGDDIPNVSTACNIAASTSNIGNGLIDTATESSCVAEQLVLAGFIKGKTTGIVSPLNNGLTPDVFVTSAHQVTVLGQPENLRVVISNLLDNAIRYTPLLGQVLVSVTLEAGHAVLRVTDNGHGIAEHERERVFDRFYRCEGSEVTGSGLGLAIVRNITEAHHATLTLSDNLAGSGLIVSVTFPT